MWGEFMYVELGLGSTSALRRKFGAFLKSMSTQLPVINVLAQLAWCFALRCLARIAGLRHTCRDSACPVLPALGLSGPHRWVACSAHLRQIHDY